MGSQRTLFNREPEDKPLVDLKCPNCGYRPVDDVLPEGQLPKSMREVERMEPLTDEQALDCFDVAGANTGCLFCPKCCCEFDSQTGKRLELDDDFDGL